ncbi:excinuclease ABC subunit UvrC [Spiroplasma endosymbiont of 'Nebria riversi']|uniref:excinuclease ABC subunit UvrC n=1 Tax=Spiroplasma endosymbiont of 'Nebria riversi' TaxID=2792084 RepID=UPI001C057C6A|nr:excinuclease ABC subunit UvrC [Spiroplasma endosymbiont of 'Nebria riversi']
MVWVKPLVLQEKIKNLPQSSGCYQFYNEARQLIYVGKAKNIQQRVNNYFNKVHNFKTTKLVREIADVDYILTINEKEALLLEHNLIKDKRPRYNILLNDDKTYPYIKITDENNPEYRFVRKVQKDNGKYYGPFPDGTGAREVLKILQQLFPLRRCKGSLGTPCLYYHLQLCSGACFKKVPEEYYALMKKKINDFFLEKNQDIKNKITERMQQAAINLQYEEAQRLKNVLDKLQLFISHQFVQFRDFRNRDFIGYAIKDHKLSITALFYRNGQLLSKDEQIFTLFNDNLTDAMRNYLQQLYTNNTVPQELYVANIVLDDLAEALNIKIINKFTKKMQEIISLATKNAQELLKQQLVDSYQINYRYYEIVEQLGKLLKIATPQYIEIMDIANLGHDNVIGGVIFYQNGQAIKKLSRRYKIQIEQQGDYHYLQNLVYRRYWKKLMNKEPMPELIIVDGGKLQIDSVQLQLENLNISLPVVGLVKNSHHKTDYLLDNKGYRLDIAKKSALFHWLTKVQEEIHNYTISFHRQQRTNSLFVNSLKKVKGLGELTIKKLYQQFETIIKMKAVSFDELNAIIKNKTTTKELIAYLKDN